MPTADVISITRSSVGLGKHTNAKKNVILSERMIYATAGSVIATVVAWILRFAQDDKLASYIDWKLGVSDNRVANMNRTLA